jgi:hypothetical protein
MASRTAWAAGNGAGLTWTAAFNAADLDSMASGDAVLSSVADIANGTNLDLYADVAIQLTIASSTIAAGAYLALYLALLNQDSSYADGGYTAGTPAARVPAWTPIGTVPLYAASSVTALKGSVQGIVLPPGSCRFLLLNESGFTLASSGNAVYYRTYNLNLNN